MRLSVSGSPEVGAGLIDGTARKLIEQFWTRFATRLGQADQAPAAPDVPTSRA